MAVVQYKQLMAAGRVQMLPIGNDKNQDTLLSFFHRINQEIILTTMRPLKGTVDSGVKFNRNSYWLLIPAIHNWEHEVCCRHGDQDDDQLRCASTYDADVQIHGFDCQHIMANTVCID